MYKKIEIVASADGQRKTRKTVCILIRKDREKRTFVVSVIHSKHGKWKLSKKFAKSSYLLEMIENSK